MSEYQHILAATDLHHECLPIVRKAAYLKELFRSKLSVVNVMPSVPYYMASGLSSVADIEQEIAAECEDEVRSALNEIKVTADIHVAHGIAKVEIVRLAKKLGVDLIIVGSHGKHGIKQMIGDTANGVLHSAKCDVFVIRIK